MKFNTQNIKVLGDDHNMSVYSAKEGAGLTYRLLRVEGHFVDRASVARQLVQDPA